MDVFPDVICRGPDRLHIRRGFLDIHLDAVSLFDDRDQLNLADGIKSDIAAQRVRVLYLFDWNLDKEILNENLLQFSGNFFFAWVHGGYPGFLAKGNSP